MLPIKNIVIPLLAEFLASQRAKATRTAYERDLLEFQTFLSTQVEAIDSVKPLHMALYRSRLATVFKPLGVNRRIAAIRSYFKFLFQNGGIDRNPCDGIKPMPSTVYRETEALTDTEVQAVLGLASNPMHAAILSILFHLGLRRGEVCGLRIDSLGANHGIPTLSVLGKGGKIRILPIPPETFTAIREYLSTRDSIREVGEPLFTSNSPNPLHPNTIRKLFQNYCKKAGITKRVSPHSARATCVSNALENGAGIHQVQHLGGWSSPSMVLRYDKRRQELKNSAVWVIKYK